MELEYLINNRQPSSQQQKQHNNQSNQYCIRRGGSSNSTNNNSYKLDHKSRKQYSKTYINSNYNNSRQQSSHNYNKQIEDYHINTNNSYNKYCQRRHNSNNNNKAMNNLAPRFQQRAVYSQIHQTDYPNSWRANLIAASKRQKHHKSQNVKQICQQPYDDNDLMEQYGYNYNQRAYFNLGVRPEPEGAPASKTDEETNNFIVIKPKSNNNHENDFDRVINDSTALFSDYGTDSDNDDRSNSSRSRCNSLLELNNNWNTATILSHAFNVADSCNKRTVLSYAVIGAELQSMTKLNTCRTEAELSNLSRKSQKLTENLDRARRGLKELALGLRAYKQDYKNSRKSQKHSKIHLSQSDLSTKSGDLINQEIRRRSDNFFPQTYPQLESDPVLPNYCTISRRHKYRKSKHHSTLSFDTKSLGNHSLNLE